MGIYLPPVAHLSATIPVFSFFLPMTRHLLPFHMYSKSLGSIPHDFFSQTVVHRAVQEYTGVTGHSCANVTREVNTSDPYPGGHPTSLELAAIILGVSRASWPSGEAMHCNRAETAAMQVVPHRTIAVPFPCRHVVNFSFVSFPAVYRASRLPPRPQEPLTRGWIMFKPFSARAVFQSQMWLAAVARKEVQARCLTFLVREHVAMPLKVLP